jgi:metallo-beta-lactamase class B
MRRILRVGLVMVVIVNAGCAMVDQLTGEDVNREVRVNGLPAHAQVLEIWDTGVTLNDDPVVGFRLQVDAEGRTPWVAETRAVVSQLAIPRIQPGAILEVRYDPLDPSRVAIMSTERTPSRGHAGSPSAPQGPAELGEDLVLEPLADGVWRHVSKHELAPWGLVPANGLLVVSGTEAALIDTPWTDDQTTRVMAWAARELGAAVTTVVPTHSHDDCMGGLAAAHAAGARSYALARTAELAAAAGKPVPQNLFTDRLALALGARRLELHYAGPGHTEDTIVVWLPGAEILFGGCLVRSARSKTLGYTAEADLERWPTTIETLRRDYPQARLIVPGHGSPGGFELLDRTLELLAAGVSALDSDG